MNQAVQSGSFTTTEWSLNIAHKSLRRDLFQSRFSERAHGPKKIGMKIDGQHEKRDCSTSDGQAAPPVWRHDETKNTKPCRNQSDTADQPEQTANRN